MPDIQVIGVAPDRPAADQIVGNLRIAGFPQEAISVIMVTPEESEELEHVDDQTGEGSKAVVGSAAKGAAIGAGVGLAGGFATLAIPDMQVVSPTILLALFGGSGAIVGSLSGAFASEDVSDEVINRYGMALAEGQVVIAVTAPDADTAKRAEEVFNAAGANNGNTSLADESPLADEPGLTDVTT